MGKKAATQVAKLYDVGSVVKLENVVPESFAGRALTDILRWRSDRWLNLGDELVERGLAKPWDPSEEPIDWCAE